MKVVCSYCRKDLGYKEPFDSEWVSHGLCPTCHDEVMEQNLALNFGELLDHFGGPVLVLSTAGRVTDINRQALEMLGKDTKQSFGLKGGEVFECRYAQLPEGCGETVFCELCSIRNTVMDTMRTGRPHLEVPVHLDQRDQRMNLLICTQKVGVVVLLKVEQILDVVKMLPLSLEAGTAPS